MLLVQLKGGFSPRNRVYIQLARMNQGALEDPEIEVNRQARRLGIPFGSQKEIWWVHCCRGFLSFICTRVLELIIGKSNLLKPLQIFSGVIPHLNYLSLLPDLLFQSLAHFSSSLLIPITSHRLLTTSGNMYQ